jgi:hypothetical protein
MSPCASCARPATALLCRGCTRQIAMALATLAEGPVLRTSTPRRTPSTRCAPCPLVAEVYRRGPALDPARRTVERHPGLLADLDDVVARRTRLTSALGGVPVVDESPLPYHDEAAELAAHARAVLTTWARVLLDLHPGLASPSDTTTRGVSRWLAQHAARLAMLPAADELADQILDLHRRVHRTVDRAVERVFLGPCGALVLVDGQSIERCGQDLYGRADRSVAWCSSCHVEHDVEKRRGELRERLRGQLATAAEISRAMPSLIGGTLAQSTIRWWVRARGLVQHDPHPRDPKRAVRYRIEDVLELAGFPLPTTESDATA